MILKIIPGRSAINAARYMAKPDAILIDTNMESIEPVGIAKEFAMVNSLKPLKHQVVHLVLSLPLGEKITPEQARHLIHEAKAELGYENCPFTAWQHLDSTKQHWHIAVTPVDYEGNRIDRGGDRFTAKKVCRRLEKELGLTVVSNQKVKQEQAPEVAAPEVQAANLRDALYAEILPAIKRSKTIADLAQDLLRHGIQMEASFGAKGASGLGFRLVGRDDTGGYMKASEVHDSFSIAKLRSKHGLDYAPGRDDQHLAAMKKKPSQPVQPILAAMVEPPPASPRIKVSADQITRHLLNSYKNRSSYAQDAHPRTPAPSRRATREATRPGPGAPAIAAAILSARLQAASKPAHGSPGGPLRPGVVRAAEAAPTPSGPDVAQAMGTGVPITTPGLAQAQPRLGGVQQDLGSRDDRRPDLDVPGQHPGGRGDGPLRGHTDDPGQAAARPRLSAPAGDLAGGGPGGRERSPRPGEARERQQDAPGSLDRATRSPSAPGARTGEPRLGRERGSRSPGGRASGLSEVAQAHLAIARNLLAALPTRKCPVPLPKVPSPRAATQRLMEPRQVPLHQIPEPPGAWVPPVQPPPGDPAWDVALDELFDIIDAKNKAKDQAQQKAAEAARKPFVIPEKPEPKKPDDPAPSGPKPGRRR